MPDECGRQWSNCIYHANGRIRSLRYTGGGWCRIHEYLFHPWQCGAENPEPTGVFPFFAQETEAPDCRSAGMYGRTSKKWTDWKASCRPGGRPGCLPDPPRPGWSRRSGRKGHQCGTFYDRNLPRRDSFTHLRKPYFRFCFHHARMQQFLPLLYRALHTRTWTQPWRGKHIERSTRPATKRLQGSNPVGAKCQLIPFWKRGPDSDLPHAAPYRGRSGARHARTFYHFTPQRHEWRNASCHRRSAQCMQAHPLARTERKFTHPKTNEP